MSAGPLEVVVLEEVLGQVAAPPVPPVAQVARVQGVLAGVGPVCVVLEVGLSKQKSTSKNPFHIWQSHELNASNFSRSKTKSRVNDDVIFKKQILQCKSTSILTSTYIPLSGR